MPQARHAWFRGLTKLSCFSWFYAPKSINWTPSPKKAGITASRPIPIREYLGNLGLGEYTTSFLEYGIDNSGDLSLMTGDDWAALQVKPLHQRKLISGLSQTASQKMSPSKVDPNDSRIMERMEEELAAAREREETARVRRALLEHKLHQNVNDASSTRRADNDKASTSPSDENNKSQKRTHNRPNHTDEGNRTKHHGTGTAQWNNKGGAAVKTAKANVPNRSHAARARSHQ